MDDNDVLGLIEGQKKEVEEEVKTKEIDGAEGLDKNDLDLHARRVHSKIQSTFNHVLKRLESKEETALR